MRALFCALALTLTIPSHETVARDDKTKQDAGKKATDAGTAEEFIRIRKEDGRQVALETNVVRFEKSKQFDGASVDLIGAVHLGDANYYKELNRLFETYDVLLFEAVMPEGADVGNPNRRRAAETDGDTMVGLSVISTLQIGMKDMLGLEFQLEGIDYTPKNFVHADMTTREFQASMRRRGESFGGMLLREMGKSLSAGPQRNPVAQQLDLMLSLLTSDRAVRLRRIMAQELVSVDAGNAFAGADGESTIITERNKKALQVLRKQLKAGHNRIGIFYGAGHLADMQQRLIDEFGFQRGKVRWLQAWNLATPAKAAAKPSEG